MQKAILKLLFVVASVKYPYIQRNYRYFVRNNYYCRLNQVKYLLKDYYRKGRYKVVDFHGEFEQELRFALPFAYWHYLNGTLSKTVSSKNTGEFYFFSPDHEEKYDQRDWKSGYSSFEIPNMTHSISFSYDKWVRVPLKAHYKNDLFVFQKPTLVIANKYNREWDGPPVNFIDIPTLDAIISRYKHKYQIVYNRPLPAQIVSDNSDILDLNEHAWLREKHPEVLLMNDLFDQYRDRVNNYNHLQLMVYANAGRFVSVHGGTAALASYFGGINIILSRKGIEHALNEYATIMPALSGATILHAKTEDGIHGYMHEYY